jgi:hypothetical protein
MYHAQQFFLLYSIIASAMPKFRLSDACASPAVPLVYVDFPAFLYLWQQVIGTDMRGDTRSRRT